MKCTRSKVAGLLLIFMLFFMSPLRAEEEQATMAGKVVWVKGSLIAIDVDKKERELQRGSPFYPKDTLKTDKNSKAQIVFTDNTLMTFREETVFYIDQYQYPLKGEGKSVGKYIMDLIRGGFRTITGAIANQNPSDYQVNTPVATIGVRGTDYTVYIGNGEVLYMGFVSGTPCVTSGSTLCLSNETKYTYVSEKGANPVPLTEPPAVITEPLEIVKVDIDLKPISEVTSSGETSTTQEAQQTEGSASGGGSSDAGGGSGGSTSEEEQAESSQSVSVDNALSQPQTTNSTNSFCIQ